MKKELENLLSQQEEFLVEGVLNKNKLSELARKYDAKLLNVLMKDEEIKKHFFSKLEEEILVFKKDVFLQFLNNKEFLPNSFTVYKNKIGLGYKEGSLLSENPDIVINFPYKDCILEGGQTKEDAKRDEIFFNETLASTEITRLLDDKVFTNFKRYDKDGEHEVKEIKEDDNFIIKGNNLVVLHSLKKKYSGKVKCIYIDPPYNTGNDSFQYNDNFNHSTWLTFMKNRLEISKEILSDNGTIAISIDNYELGYLLVLLDEVFGKENRKNIITVKRASASGAKVINPGVVNLVDYIVLYSKDTKLWKPNRVFMSKGYDTRYNGFIKNRKQNHYRWQFTTVLEEFSEQVGIKKSQLKKYFGSDYEEELNKFVINNSDSVFRWVALDDSQISTETIKVKQESQKNPESIYHIERKGFKDYYIKNGQAILFAEDRIMNIDGRKTFSTPISDIWDDCLPNDLHNEGGVSLKKGKKPEKLISRILELTTNENDIVLDYHLGSGTTAAVAHKLNRQYIGVEQMEYIENKVVSRLRNVIQGEEKGISKSINWQGGGEFVYCELKNEAEDFKNSVIESQSTGDLIELFNFAKKSSFLSYRVEPKKLKEKEFLELSFSEQKQLLLEIIDQNNLYVNFSDIDDDTYGISEDEKKLNKEFYGGE
ncbi:DNA methyltransferase [Gemella sp.]